MGTKRASVGSSKETETVEAVEMVSGWVSDEKVRFFAVTQTVPSLLGCLSADLQ